MSDKRVDPRYDPVFQPGFDGQVVRGLTRRPDAPQPASAATPAIDTLRGAPRAAVVTPPARVEAVAAPRVAPPVADAVLVAADEQPAAAPAPRRRPVWANPFLLLATLLGVVAIVAGISGMSALAQQGSFGNSDNGYLYFAFMQLGGPMLVILGIATLIGVCFFLALHWQRPRA